MVIMKYNNKYIILIYVLILSWGVNAQDSFQQVLRNIESNNTTLKALQEQTKADKISNKTALNLENPEVGVGYLWGSPTGEGNRKDLSITQSFDFPTAYRYRSQVVAGQNTQADLAYRQQAKEILQEARAFCVELVYQTKVYEELIERVKFARELREAYQIRFDKGDINIIEYNKTKLNLLNEEKALQICEVEIATLRAELERMNGGEPLMDVLDTYSNYVLPLSFDQWFTMAKVNNPALELAEKEVDVSRKQEKLTKALNLPKISAGYMSERLLGATHQGVTLGISIPLWEGKNTVKHQKAQTLALQVQHKDSELQFYNNLKNQYSRASTLSGLLRDYEEVLNVSNNKSLLKKAFDKGQLSLIDYLLELSIYYDTIDEYLERERDYQLALSELQQWDS